MQEAYGGILSFVLLVVFLVLVEGILGFIVVYSRTFKMKNEIITIVENYEGLGCGMDYDVGSSRRIRNNNTACVEKIHKAAEKINYKPIENLTCPRDSSGDQWIPHETKYFCYKTKPKDTNNDWINDTVAYSIMTQMNINFPIVNKLGFSIFRVGGDTKSLKIRS